jgi:plastocyanin
VSARRHFASISHSKEQGMQPSRRAAAVCVTMVALVLPAAAPAATKQVFMGTPPSAGKSFERLRTDINDYFPHTATIRQGDSVRFVPVGFHNVDIPARGGSGTPLVSPTGQKVAGAKDAAGTPFWFNGQDQLGFTPELGQSNFGKTLTYTGAKEVNSGLPLAQRPKPMTVKFTRRGTFTYLCSIHAGMKGKVKVLRRTASVPSARADARAVARQIATAKRRAAALPDAKAPANTVNVGVAGKGGLELFAFVPQKLKVTRGTTVTFRMSPGSYDVHTATAGPGDPEKQPQSYLGKLAESFNAPVFAPEAAYSTEPPGTIASMTSTLHGNGFWNSGVMDTSSASPLPASNRVRFDTPGSYTFLCLIHPFMKGTVDVG